jgi:formate dehydrogenase subunit gamma
MIERFGRTERALHWVHATGFFAMLATGLVLYLPALSELVARRNLVKNVHIFAALAWAIAIVLVVVLGDRRRLAADWREIETLDRDDRRWLRGGAAAQGRFNAGQKVNAIVTAAFAVLFAISGFFLWLGERDHRFLLDGTGTVHDTLTLLSVGIVSGPPLPRPDPPDDAARAAGDDARRGPRGLGARASREVARRAARAITPLWPLTATSSRTSSRRRR